MGEKRVVAGRRNAGHRELAQESKRQGSIWWWTRLQRKIWGRFSGLAQASAALNEGGQLSACRWRAAKAGVEAVVDGRCRAGKRA